MKINLTTISFGQIGIYGACSDMMRACPDMKTPGEAMKTFKNSKASEFDWNSCLFT